MTRADLLSAWYADCNHPASPAAAVTTRAATYMNEGMRRVLGTPGLTHFRTSDSTFALTATASQARYVVPESVERIRMIQNRTNNIVLQEMTLEQYRRIEPDPTEISSTPSHYVPIGRVAVAVQPSNASRLFVDSTSASDTANALVEGYITGGYMRQVTKAMTGTTGVDVDTTITTWVEVTDFYVSSAAVGTITLLEDSESGTELARITIGASRPRYFGFYLWPTPSAADSYVIDFDRRVVDLSNNTDEPPWSENYHWIVLAYMRAREYEKTENTRYQEAMREFDRGLRELRAFTQNTPNYTPSTLKRQPGRSRLGSWYPAERY